MKHYSSALLTALAVFHTSILLSCTPTSGARVLSTVDAIGRGVSRVLGWCEDNDVHPADVVKAQKALADEDYATAVKLAASIVEAAQKSTGDVPDEVMMLVKLVEAAQAVQGMQEGLSHISNP